ncbi:MAG: prepilin-type N-terminal cleavage/methylation domain-containing protein [Phycisphaerae bacterium]
MARSRRKAFTLVELLVVIVILSLLMALLVPSLRGVWQRYNMTRCQSNLFHIYQAFRLRAADEAMGAKEAYPVAAWPTVLAPYLENDASQFRCMETSAAGAVSIPSITELVELRMHGPGGYIQQMEQGPYMLRLSVTQYTKARGMNLLSNADAADDMNTNYPEFATYVPDGTPDVYWLCMEDHGGDNDFKDVMTRVTVNEVAGEVKLECISGYTIWTENALMDKLTREVLFTTGSDNWNFSPARTVTLEGAAMDASYGMNEYAIDKVAGGKPIRRGVGGAGGKILVMDYLKLEAKTTDAWADEKWDPDRDGVPVFARHFGQANVLFSDGSVHPERPEDIDPIAPTTAMKWWMP